MIENPNEAVANGFTPIYVAAQNGHLEVVKVLASIIENPNAPADGFTPIYIAAEMGHLEIVKLLASKSDDFYSLMPNGFTPIQIATQMLHTDVVEFMLSFVDLLQTTHFGGFWYFSKFLHRN